eukprot:2821238-Lingulodinium_polyedra.AAC.1
MGGNVVEFVGGDAVTDHPVKHVAAPPVADAVRLPRRCRGGTICRAPTVWSPATRTAPRPPPAGGG